MKRYNPKEIEPKWQKAWEQDAIYTVDFNSSKPKYVGFAMFNYPSGAGIHVGHVRNYTIPDVITRVKRQQGFESYQPVGWDSFGLPAENFAIKTGVSPQESTVKAIEKYHDQYRAMGWAVDWQKEINTTDPKYYKWTQWIFTKLFEHGLAYQQESAQWWCDQCMTVLADEQVIAGKCWRHDGDDDPLVGKKSLKQWFFKITAYADEMLEATDDLDWTQSVKASQKSWIGKSVGAEIDFKIKGSEQSIKVFTTRPDTLFGATFLVLAPENPLVEQITTNEQKQAVADYQQATLLKSDVQRQQEADKEKTGVFTGGYAINPANNEQIPIWIADYVLMGYGTGAIMGVPGHDERDFAFADSLIGGPIINVIDGGQADDECYHGEGMMINSGSYNGLSSNEARDKIVADLAAKGLAEEKTNYKMRDWLISRQRYWGSPIPIIHCEKCGTVAVPETDLPVLLPEIKEYKPTGGNASVLAGVEDWVNVPCPNCEGPGKRETDTMDGYVCSSWYFFRYLDPVNDSQAWDPAQVKKWAPIDCYNGGDHATAHLLYARFFTRFFHKIGLSAVQEPFKKMIYNGKVRASDGSNFSKSKGNGIDPLQVIESGYGADAIRVYEMFAAPVELDVLWDEQGIPGSYRFLNRIWNITQEFLEAPAGDTPEAAETDLKKTVHRAIKKVTHDIEEHKFNTSIAAMMEAINGLYKAKEAHGMQQSGVWRFAVESMVQLVAPYAPHIAEELWHDLGYKDSVHVGHWPEWDDALLVADAMIIAVQVNGKLRGEVEVDIESNEEQVIEAAKAQEKVAGYLADHSIKKAIYVPKKLVNFVI